LTAVAGGVALFCPEAALPIFTGTFLGCLLALVLVLRPRAEPLPGESPSRVSRISGTLARATGVLAVVLLLGWAVCQVRAQELAAKATGPVADEVYRVYTPVDADNEPAGEYVFLPRVFYDALHRQAGAGAADQLPWLIRTADYRVAVQDVGTDETGGAVEFVARLELQVSQPGTKVRLPVRSEQVYLLPNRARLDGQPATVTWAPDGSALEIETAGVGPAVLELAFRPQVERREGAAGFDVQIPRVAHAHVRSEQPVAMKDVQVTTALGGVGLDDKTGERIVELGPAGRLAVEWPLDSDVAASATDLEVDQLLWLHVQPHAVMLDAKLTWASLGRPVRQVRLQTDPRLRLLPPADDQPIEQFSAQAGDVPLVSFDLRAPYQKEVTFQVRFLVADTTGIGTLRLPRFQPLADRVRRRWLAVSTSPALELDRPAAVADFVREPAAFTTAWGPAEPLPQLVLELPAATTSWPLTTQLRTTRVSAEQRVEVVFGAEYADVLFTAEVQVSDGEVFQHRLRAPKDLLVSSVSVADDGEDRAARWSRDEQGGVIVMLNGPLTAAHRLRLTGKVPLGKLRRTKVPVLVLSGATLRADRVEVYRRPEVQVSLAELTGYTALADARPDEYHKGRGRLVAAWEAKPGGPRGAGIQVNLAPNEPRPRGRLIIELSREADAWQAVADYELQPESGVIDAVRFDIPAEWTGPFQVDPPANLETVDLSGRSRRLLVLRPSAAIAHASRLRVRGTLAAVPGERVRAPDILPLDVEQVERYLVAPTKLQQREIAWETSGLQEVSLPDRYGPPNFPSYVTYRAIGPRFQATIKDVKIESGSPQVRLADVAVQVRADGSVFGTATFDLEPAALTACDLELPEDYELVHVNVAHLPAFAEPLGEQRWRLRLFPSQLPQPIEVVFSGPSSEHGMAGSDRDARSLSRLRNTDCGGARTLRSPRLLAVPVERTIWTVQGPFALDATSLPADAVTDPWSHELCRLRNVAARVQTAASVLSESDPQELVRWYHPWAWRWSAIHSRLEQWRRQPAPPADRDASELTALDRQQATLTTRLRAAGFQLPATVSARWAAERDSTPPDVTTHRLQNAGFLDSVVIHPRPAPTRHLAQRLLAALALVGVALVTFLLLPHPFPNGRVPRWPPLLGLGLGLAWWQWCTPPLLGLFLSLSSLAIWLTAVWPTRRPAARIQIGK
jgi:hypothetical protein